jgi:hypothetical protein
MHSFRCCCLGLDIPASVCIFAWGQWFRCDVFQVVEVRAQRDEAITALEAARLKLSESEVLLPDSPMAKRHVQIDGSKPAARQEQLSLELQAVMMAAEAEQVSSVENRNSQIRQLQDLLSQAQEQLRQQHLQHEHQRALLQRSCQELQSEASLASSNLVACKREVDLLKLRLEEVEVCGKRGVFAWSIVMWFMLNRRLPVTTCDWTRYAQVW